VRSIAASPARTALKISQLTRRPPGGMPLMNSLATRGRELDALRATRTAKDPDEAQRLLAAELPGEFAAVRTRPRNHFTSCLYRDAGSFANGIKTPTIATDLIPAAQLPAPCAAPRDRTPSSRFRETKTSLAVPDPDLQTGPAESRLLFYPGRDGLRPVPFFLSSSLGVREFVARWTCF
jgi:hypothetical protein